MHNSYKFSKIIEMVNFENKIACLVTKLAMTIYSLQEKLIRVECF